VDDSWDPRKYGGAKTMARHLLCAARSSPSNSRWNRGLDDKPLSMPTAAGGGGRRPALIREYHRARLASPRSTDAGTCATMFARIDVAVTRDSRSGRAASANRSCPPEYVVWRVGIGADTRHPQPGWAVDFRPPLISWIERLVRNDLGRESAPPGAYAPHAGMAIGGQNQSSLVTNNGVCSTSRTAAPCESARVSWIRSTLTPISALHCCQAPKAIADRRALRTAARGR
jgi:hypothetical protein